MRAGIVTVLIALCLPVTVLATSLRLSNDIDLLVLDGKKVSSSLLRGADSIELENGPHQLVFRVEKTIRLSSHEERLYISPPLVISFNTQMVSQVNFHLPRLSNERDATHFDSAPRVELLDGDSMPIPVKLDIMAITSKAKIVDYEIETERYNKAARHASLPQFAPMMADDSSLLSGVSELDRVPPQSQTLTEQRLKYWFQQADSQTRSNFLQWAQKQPPS
ncbi:DUF2057 family protein [Citrobacter freundii]|uniref:UPF0319 protein DJ535_13485 n=2 Tax=Enterobacteriaceae TaxID=543 RepID=A0ABY2PU10_9ENTR|nr:MULTISPECIES: DUF2057 family protein [Citrobacter]MCQ7060564.1 DUF2057 family protein [Escherichia coli]KLV64638.1 hypothetical protein SK36_02676 [Citrobacter sp. MGH106]MBJ9874722.1 DUF2057 family protein [Citrobacter werkmanii]MDK2358457.1 DUF2057 family protein [Citrobacter freundii]MDM2928351.1 DUF2057 family protein [Citrobacter sp. Cm046]